MESKFGEFFFQQNIFPEAGTIYDYVFIKQGNGSWSRWLDTIDKHSLTIPADAKVSETNNF